MSEKQVTAMPPSRTLLLWLAALAVSWISGIEPTWRKVQDVNATFEAINLQRHEADRKAISQQRLYDGERAELAALKFFTEQFPQGATRDGARASLFNKLVAAQSALGSTKAATTNALSLGNDAVKPCASSVLTTGAKAPRGSTDAERRYASAIDRLRNFCEAERRLDQFSNDKRTQRLNEQRAILQEGEVRHRKALADARVDAERVREKSNVDFELLGVKFTAEPLLASFLWSSFAFAWLVATRQESQAPPQQPPPAAAVPGVVDLRLLTLLALLAWAMQLRVTWLGLGIIALTGDTMWKALVAIAVLLLFVGSAIMLAIILARRPLAVATNRRTLAAQWLAAAVVVLCIGVFAAAWWMPSPAIHLSHALRQWVPALGVFPLLVLGLLWWLARMRAAAAPAARGRRVFLGGSASLLVLSVAGTAWWWRQPQALPVGNYKNAFRHPRRRHPRPAPSKLESGFYRNANPRRSVDAPVIVHYIGARGWYSRRGRLAQSMQAISRPSYIWQSAFKRLDLYYPFETPLTDTGAATDVKDSAPKQWDLASYRVALATASTGFESAALLMLSTHLAGRKNVRRACELLLNGIHHDMVYKTKHPNARRRSAPSYRLYDLAAGLAVRYNQPQIMEELKQRIKLDGYGLVFESRLAKWDDVNSVWYRRWRERRVPVRWQSNQQVSVF